MWRPKSCTRCGGDLFLTHEGDCYEFQCISCGRPHNPSSEDLKMIAITKDMNAALGFTQIPV